MTDVQCDGCTACCRGKAGGQIELYDDDNVHLRAEHPDFVIRRLPNGDCPYVNAGGCTIRSIRPIKCREFDCRDEYKKFAKLPRHDRRRIAKDFGPILEAGRTRS